MHAKREACSEQRFKALWRACQWTEILRFCNELQAMNICEWAVVALGKHHCRSCLGNHPLNQAGAEGCRSLFVGGCHAVDM